jgi:Cu(I)/Ag(I) efflux system membrane fusion protein
VEIADTSKLELVADVPAHDLVLLRPGATASLSLAALPDREFKASVSRVAPSVDRTTGLGTVHIAIAASEEPRPPVGTFGVARVDSGEPHLATLVPKAAIRSVVGGEGEVVVCGPDHVAHVHKVAPGAARDGRVEVRGELGRSDQVIVDPVLGISDGEAIEAAK